MRVLDELRQKLVILHNQHDKSGARDREQRAAGIREALAALDAFEAAHPGLLDRTRFCRVCHAPIVTDYMRWQSFDPATTWVCGACAKEATDARA